LACPEHHLRQFINRILKFNNFSSYLNHYRLRDARQQLADHSLAAVPILTLALNLGYGSIGPFNRAFKAMTGQTPSEYRRHFQNRR
jgi:AraC-like DNA-binding protein